MCWVMRAMKSHGLNTSKLRWIFGFIAHGEKPERIRLLFSAHVATYIRERVWHPSQILRQHRDGSLEMRIETSGHKELVRWVLSWMPDVEVLAPQSLREREREKLCEALGSSAIATSPPRSRNSGSSRSMTTSAGSCLPVAFLKKCPKRSFAWTFTGPLTAQHRRFRWKPGSKPNRSWPNATLGVSIPELYPLIQFRKRDINEVMGERRCGSLVPQGRSPGTPGRNQPTKRAASSERGCSNAVA
ncbi:MAG: WYL domain-containing protein [Terrimicrobiaceae bacterium]